MLRTGRDSPPEPPRDHCPAEGLVGENGEAGTLTAQAAAMLPPQAIEPGEIIILLLKPHWLFIILAPLPTLVGLVLLTVLATMLNNFFFDGLYRREVLLIGLVAIALRLFWQFIEWLSRAYVLTDRRIIRVRGVLRVSVFETPLTQIQNTEVSRIVREQLFGLGTIIFSTAGTAVPEAFWEMLARPFEVHQKVVQTIRRYRG
jgi:uncharacterized membrane protein YdbT with pleckstrin-like domain